MRVHGLVADYSDISSNDELRIYSPASPAPLAVFDEGVWLMYETAVPAPPAA